ncbi:MAG: hypothetical protein R3193_09140 [Marinobacter sp.]|nr:hypothetical protein [Marinobacter sp.]
MNKRLEILRTLRDYFSDRADAEYFTDSPSPVANEEMEMLALVEELEAPTSGEVEPVAWECSGEPGTKPDVVTSMAAADHYQHIGRTVRPLVYADTHPPAKVPEGWQLVEHPTCYQLHRGNEIVAVLAGPSAEANAEKLKALLTTPTPATTPETEWVKCHAETAAIALEALHFYADERFKGFGDDPEPYEHHLAQQAISELQELLPTPSQEREHE